VEWKEESSIAMLDRIRTEILFPDDVHKPGGEDTFRIALRIPRPRRPYLDDLPGMIHDHLVKRFYASAPRFHDRLFSLRSAEDVIPVGDMRQVRKQKLFDCGIVLHGGGAAAQANQHYEKQIVHTILWLRKSGGIVGDSSAVLGVRPR
jgi:hypothetical protein